MNDRGNELDRSTAGDADAELDALLTRAAWPAPSPEATARLRAQWQALRHRPARHIWRWSGLAAAAGAAAMVALAWRLKEPPVDRTAPPTPLTSVVEPESPTPHRPQAWREPTAIEVALVHNDVLPNPLTEVRPTPRQTVETAIQSLLHTPQSDIPAVAKATARSTSPKLLERELTDVLANCYGPRRRATAQLLGEVASARSLPLLWQLVADPDTRAPAYAALRRLADPADLAAFAQREAESARHPRSTLLIPNSVNRHGALAIALYAAAAATAQPAPGPPANPATEGLFAQLSDRNADARVRAARALAQQAGGEVTARLVRMAEENVNRREALIALASSNDPDARAFLSQAAESPAMAGAVRSALIQYRP